MKQSFFSVQDNTVFSFLVMVPMTSNPIRLCIATSWSSHQQNEDTVRACIRVGVLCKRYGHHERTKVHVRVNTEIRDREMDLCPQPQLGQQQSFLGSCMANYLLPNLFRPPLSMLCALQLVAEVDVQIGRHLIGHTQHQLAEPAMAAARGLIITRFVWAAQGNCKNLIVAGVTSWQTPESRQLSPGLRGINGWQCTSNIWPPWMF